MQKKFHSFQSIRFKNSHQNICCIIHRRCWRIIFIYFLKTFVFFMIKLIMVIIIATDNYNSKGFQNEYNVCSVFYYENYSDSIYGMLRLLHIISLYFRIGNVNVDSSLLKVLELLFVQEGMQQWQQLYQIVVFATLIIIFKIKIKLIQQVLTSVKQNHMFYH